MQTNVRTVYGARIQAAQLLGRPVGILENSTLNQKFNVFPEELFGANEQPVVQYLTIGNGGHRSTLGADGIPLIDAIPHSPRHAALYNHIPFIMREVNNDLSTAERQNYRLRVLETHDGTNYVAYYGLKLDLTSASPTIEMRNNTSGTITSTPFAPNSSDLNPVRPTASSSGSFTPTGDSLAVTAKVEVNLSTSLINEILNACNIIYGSPEYAFISELGLCAGVDRSLSATINGTVSSYTEAVGCQIVNFAAVAFPLYAINTEINYTLDVGAVEPLLFT